VDSKFRIIEYREIDLDKSKALLQEQGLLLVDLGWFRARTMRAMLDEEAKFRDPKFLRRGRALVHDFPSQSIDGHTSILAL
jgi:hypothetical protein